MDLLRRQGVDDLMKPAQVTHDLLHCRPGTAPSVNAGAKIPKSPGMFPPTSGLPVWGETATG